MLEAAKTTFPELIINSPRKGVHFVGVGGIGMSALARWFLAQKTPVSGSDLTRSAITQELAKEGLNFKIGHKKKHITRNLGLIVYSQAIKPSNPERKEARRLGIPAISYPEAVGELTRRYNAVAVAGAHGKSTTTALVALVLQKAGLDPTVIVGTNLREFGDRNFRAGLLPFGKPGAKPYLVLEADEFGKAFLRYSPAVAVVTNIDLEHLDTYKNLADIKSNFFKFLSNTKQNGILILNKDSKNLRSLASRIKKLAERRDYRVLWYSLDGDIAKKIRRVLKIPGEHNVSNVLAAYKTGRSLGISNNNILSAIGSYRGSWRRFEYRGAFHVSRSKFQVYDDYAHHPTEIRATLKAFREKYPLSPIICVYQPHQALRLKKLWRGFVGAFGDADVLIFLPLYKVAGRDSLTSSGQAKKYNSRALAAAIKRKYPNRPVFYLPNPKNIKKFLSQVLNSKSYILNPGILVMMGAGDIVNYTTSLLRP